jgi:Domain of unknown function (DUF927)
MTKHLGPAIVLTSKVDEPRQIRRFDRTGWWEDKFLVPGREVDGVRINLPQKLAYHIDATADLGCGIKALQHLMVSIGPETSTVVVSTVFQAPLADLAGWRDERYGVFLEGRTGSLKTSFMQAAMSVYGRGFLRDSAMLKWGEGGTRNALMALATHAADMPLLIDNFKLNTGEGARGFVNLVHAILKGGEKERLTRASELRAPKPIYAWPFLTGEATPNDDPASLARLLVVTTTWPQGEPNKPLAAAQRWAPHLSAVGGSWVAWLESPQGHERAHEAAELFHEFRTK